MKRFLLVIGLLAAMSQPAQAVEIGQHVFADVGQILNLVACNASAGSRTWTSSAGVGAGFSVAVFQLDFTWAAATNVIWTCEGSLNNGTSWAYFQSCSVASGVCTSSDASFNKAVSASKNVLFRLDFLGVSDIRCVLSCTGGGANDKTSVYGRLSVQ